MARFGSSSRLACWAGLCPGNHESAGKSEVRQDAQRLEMAAATLSEAAEAAGHSKSTYLCAQFARLRGRRGHAKARKAVEHSILVAAYHVLDARRPLPRPRRRLVPSAAPTPMPVASPARSRPSATASASSRRSRLTQLNLGTTSRAGLRPAPRPRAPPLWSFSGQECDNRPRLEPRHDESVRSRHGDGRAGVCQGGHRLVAGRGAQRHPPRRSPAATRSATLLSATSRPRPITTR